jgi:hypothetical protein
VPTVVSGGVDGRADAAPGGGGLRVVEKGITQVSKGFRVSLGAVVENTSGQVAYRARVTFAYSDAHGRSVVPPNRPELAMQIPVILPGQRIPVGNWSYVVWDADDTLPVVADVQVTLGSVRWLPSGSAFAQITARPHAAARSDVSAETASVTYTVDSHYCRALTPHGVAMVFRDRTGRVVGGSLDLISAQEKCQPGLSDADADAFESMPLGIDESRTEVYPYCDPAPRAPATIGATDIPFNYR